MDIQFFKGIEGKTLPKEVAIIALNSESQSHWIIKPPYNSTKISYDSQRQNNRLTHNHHGLNWYDGDISGKILMKNLQLISKKAGKVYVRGREKVAFLHKIIASEVINLELETECPSFQNLPRKDSYCIQHAIKFNHVKYNCALNNALRLKTWLNQNLKNLSQGEDTIDTNNEQLGNFAVSLVDTVSHGWSISG